MDYGSICTTYFKCNEHRQMVCQEMRRWYVMSKEAVSQMVVMS